MVTPQPAALITGILGGIGSSLGTSFKKQGYHVIGLDIRTPPAELDVSSLCDQFFQFDLNKFCRDDNYFEQQKASFAKAIPSLHVLINNAAVQLLGHVADITTSDWEETLAVNLTGPLRLSQLFLSRLESSGGAIINIASIHQTLTKARFVAYATSKSALVGLTKAMAVDLQNRVRVNAISPAAIETNMLRAGFNDDESAIDKLRALHPIQRIGYPEEVANLAIFLASNQAQFITGANFTLDGGISSVLHDL